MTFKSFDEEDEIVEQKFAQLAESRVVEPVQTTLALTVENVVDLTPATKVAAATPKADQQVEKILAELDSTAKALQSQPETTVQEIREARVQLIGRLGESLIQSRLSSSLRMEGLKDVIIKRLQELASGGMMTPEEMVTALGVICESGDKDLNRLLPAASKAGETLPTATQVNVTQINAGAGDTKPTQSVVRIIEAASLMAQALKQEQPEIIDVTPRLTKSESE